MTRFNGVLQVAVALLLLSSRGFAQVSDFAGSYFGLIGQPGAAPVGSVQVVLNRAGHGSVAVRIEHQAPAVALVSVTPDGIVAPSRAIDRRLQVYLSVTPGTGAGWNVVGTVSESGIAYPVTLVGSTGTAGGAEGTYTLALDTTPAAPSTAASLAGVVSANVSPSGNVRLIGSLADGTLIFQGGYVNANGEVEWFVGTPRSGSAGSFHVSFPTSASGAVSGSGTLEDATGLKTVAITGSHFSAAAGFGSSPGWELNTYSGTDPTALATVDGITAVAHHPTVLRAGGAVPVTLVLDPHTGLVAGDYGTLSQGRPVHHLLVGAVFQDSNTSEGFVLQKSVLGRFRLTASSSTIVSSTSSGGLTFIGGANFNNTVSSGGTLSMGGTLNLTGGAVIGGTSITLLGANTSATVLTAGNSLQKTGTGTLVLGSAPGTLTQGPTTGGTLVVGPGTNGGSLTVSGPNTASYTGLTVVSSGSLNLGSGAVFLNSTGSTNFNTGAVASGGPITINPGATLLFSSAVSNTFTPPSIVGGGTVIFPTGGALGSGAGALHLGAAFFSGFAATGYVPPTFNLPNGTTVTLDVALPTGWSIAVNGVTQTTSTFVVAGATGAGSVGKVTFVYTPPAAG